jgi:hypothetical protein
MDALGIVHALMMTITLPCMYAHPTTSHLYHLLAFDPCLLRSVVFFFTVAIVAVAVDGVLRRILANNTTKRAALPNRRC